MASYKYDHYVAEGTEDIILVIGGQDVVGVIDDGIEGDPKLVVWNADGDAVFSTSLLELNDSIEAKE